MAPVMRPTSRLLFVTPFLATGAGLVIYILSGISLPLGIALVAAGGVLLAIAAWRRSSGQSRDALRDAFRAGVISGVLATLAYDVTRVLLVKVVGFAFWPFDTFSRFGQALLGTASQGPWVTTAGTTFHLVNGIGFAVAYTMCFGRRGILAGIAWAFMLELAMVSLYPGWLGLKALDEFLSISIVGHLAYGSVLSLVSQRLLQSTSGAEHIENVG